MRKTVKAVIFDFGNVLTLLPVPGNIQRMQEACNLNPEQFMAVYRENRIDFDRGTINSTEYWSRILKTGNIRPTRGRIKKLINHDIETWTKINYPLLD